MLASQRTRSDRLRSLRLLGAALLVVPLCACELDPAIVCNDGLTLAGVDDTLYAPHYSHRAFCAAQVGQSAAEIRASLGEPLLMAWRFRDVDFDLQFSKARADWVVTRGWDGVTKERELGETMASIRRRYGEPTREAWAYSVSGPSNGNYRVRVLVLAHGKVTEKTAKYCVD